MANYREIKGFAVQSLSADPSLGSGSEGQVWFNSTSGKLKSLVAITGWSSSSAMNAGRKGGNFSFGTQTAAIIAGGTPPTAGLSEEYNGSGWAVLPTINSVRYGGSGAGTTTAGLIMGSASPTPLSTATETYNGSTWTSVNSLTTGHGNAAGGGILTAAWVAGGSTPGITQVTEEFDGTNWTAGGSMTSPAGASGLFGVGPLTAGIAGGGQNPPTSQFDTAETYDGTSWSSTGAINTARGWAGSSGDSSAAIIFGGNPGSGTYTTAETETYDGASWSTSPASMGTARNDVYSAGTTTSAALVSGGEPVPVSAYTEEFNQSLNVRTAGAWASAGSFNTGRQAFNGMGITTAALVAGGEPITTNSESYDGTTWTEGPNITTGRGKMGAAGTQTAGVIYGGYISTPVGNTDVTEEFNGSAWSTSPGTLFEDISQQAAFGTLTTAVSAGGYNYKASPPKARAVTQEYNGTTWASNPSPSGDLGTARYDMAGAGTQTAGLAIGGNPGTITNTEEYGGTTWTAGGALIAGKGTATAAGTQTDAIVSGGPGTAVFGYDGAAWSTRPSMATPRSELGGTTPAPASDTLAMGGSPGLSTGEIFTGAVETATASLITST